MALIETVHALLTTRTIRAEGLIERVKTCGCIGGRVAGGLAVLHILLEPVCGGSLVSQRSPVAEDRFDKDECATTYPFAHSSHSRALGFRADPQDSAPPHSLREERMCNTQTWAHARGIPDGTGGSQVAQAPGSRAA